MQSRPSTALGLAGAVVGPIVGSVIGPILGPILGIAPLAAQSYVYSPAAAATVEQNDNNTIPWWSPGARYQQAHGSLRGTPITISAIAFRRDGGFNNAQAVARTLDAELSMAGTNFAMLSGVFANNYASAPATTVTRKLINLPDFTVNQGSPAPWQIVIPHDTPYPHAAVQDLLWELKIHSNTSMGTYPCDAFGGFAFDVAAAANTTFGTGCIPSGRSMPTSISAVVQSVTPTNSLRVSWTVLNGPTAAAGAAIVGTAGIDRAIPGLCSNLYVDSWLLTIAATTSATGSFTTTPVEGTPFDPGWAGLSLFAQAVVADPGQTSGIGVAVSNRVESVVAPLPAGSPDKIRRIHALNPNAATGTLEYYNYGLVVRFTH